MKSTNRMFIVRKILVAFLPAVIFWQNYAWMTLNAYSGIAFLLILALMIWNVWQYTESNHITERYFRLTEIGFFLLPVSAIVFSFVLGAQSVSSTTDKFEQAGAAIGTAIGGAFVVILAFIIGIVGGIIMHLVTEKYAKKARHAQLKQSENLPGKHRVILSLAAVILLVVIMGSIASTARSQQLVKEKNELSQNLQQAGTAQMAGSPTPALTLLLSHEYARHIGSLCHCFRIGDTAVPCPGKCREISNHDTVPSSTNAGNEKSRA